MCKCGGMEEIIWIKKVFTERDSYMKRIKRLLTVLLISGMCLTGTYFVYNTIPVSAKTSRVSITKDTFGSNKKIHTVHIGYDVYSIEDGALNLLPNLKKIKVNSKNPNYCSYKGVLYNKDKTKLLAVPRGRSRVPIIKTITSRSEHSVDGIAQSRINHIDKIISRNKAKVNNNPPASSTDFSQYVYTDSDGNRVFEYRGKGISTINIPNGTDYIGYITTDYYDVNNDTSSYTFNYDVTTIYIPASVQCDLMGYVFDSEKHPDNNLYSTLYSCRNLKKIVVDSNNPYLYTNADGTVLYRKIANKPIWSANKIIIRNGHY